MEALKKQITIHPDKNNETTERKLECKLCNKRFNNFIILKNHTTFYMGEKPFRFDYREKGFETKDSLKKHIYNHTRAKPYCEHCDKRFTSSGRLKQHITSHTKAKPFECFNCDNKFTSVCTLRYHVRIHTGENLFRCEHCHKKFSKSYEFKRHESNYTSEKIYKCEHYDKTLTDSSSSKYHVLIEISLTIVNIAMKNSLNRRIWYVMLELTQMRTHLNVNIAKKDSLSQYI